MPQNSAYINSVRTHLKSSVEAWINTWCSLSYRKESLQYVQLRVRGMQLSLLRGIFSYDAPIEMKRLAVHMYVLYVHTSAEHHLTLAPSHESLQEWMTWTSTVRTWKENRWCGRWGSEGTYCPRGMRASGHGGMRASGHRVHDMERRWSTLREGTHWGIDEHLDGRRTEVEAETAAVMMMMM